MQQLCSGHACVKHVELWESVMQPPAHVVSASAPGKHAQAITAVPIYHADVLPEKSQNHFWHVLKILS